MVFDGREMARELVGELSLRVKQLRDKLGRKPKLVAIRDANNASSVAYTGVKRKMAQDLEVEMVVVDEPNIEKWNQDPGIDGIMVQLPYPGSAELIDKIEPKKDVDGLREDSPFLQATVRAVMEISRKAGVNEKMKVVVVGNKGEVGRRLVGQMRAFGMDKEDFDSIKLKEADVVVSATGQPGLIGAEMVKEGVITIDVGYPKGDFDAEVAHKAVFFTPVPGGVGPMTVVMLFKNLVEAAEKEHI